MKFTAVAILAIGLAGLLAVDAVNPIFPDDLYCLLGAGTSVPGGMSTRPSSWSANNGCNAYVPGCATSYTATQYAGVCYHRSMWDAYKPEFLKERERAQVEERARQIDPDYKPVPNCPPSLPFLKNGWCTSAP